MQALKYNLYLIVHTLLLQKFALKAQNGKFAFPRIYGTQINFDAHISS